MIALWYAKWIILILHMMELSPIREEISMEDVLYHATYEKYINSIKEKDWALLSTKTGNLAKMESFASPRIQTSPSVSLRQPRRFRRRSTTLESFCWLYQLPNLTQSCWKKIAILLGAPKTSAAFTGTLFPQKTSMLYLTQIVQWNACWIL